MTRKEAREAVFSLLFETEFQTEKTPEEIYELARLDREFPDNSYIRNTYFGVLSHLEELDAAIGKHANGWRTDRLSRVSRAVIRLAVYELYYAEDIPSSVILNEAVELSKKFDDPKARAFVNGVLNAVKNDMGNREEKRPDSEQGSEGEAEMAEHSAEHD